MKIISFYTGHDCNSTFYDTESGEVFIIEYERLEEKRYFAFPDNKEDADNLFKKALALLKQKGIENDFDVLVYSNDGQKPDFSIFNAKKKIKCSHHVSHALGAYALSPFEECNVLSYDGGGDDGTFLYFKVNPIELKQIAGSRVNLGFGYQCLSMVIAEVQKNTSNNLALAGKTMGFCSYGESIDNLLPTLIDFYHNGFSGNEEYYNQVTFPKLGFAFSKCLLSSYMGANFAATIQKSFELYVSTFFDSIGLPENLCVTGGCALNILTNEMLRKKGINIFVPPNPNDCGLSLGQAVYAQYLRDKKIKKIGPVTYKGIPILDLENLDKEVEERGAKDLDVPLLARKIKNGELIGVCLGDSEVGPRALGNRSIICDPTFPEMKDKINGKIKHREWYRPFAGVCRLQDAEKFFYIDGRECEFMTFAPLVRKEYREKLKSITHIDGTCRLQTITEQQHPFLFNLLSQPEFEESPVLLNTSFNINGKPILSTVSSALSVLDNTELDAVVIENKLFCK